MGDFDLTYIETAENAAATEGITITANSTINTKGAYTELIASTASSAVMMRLTVHTDTTNVSNMLIDISTGAASSEVVLIPDIMLYADSGANQQNPPTTAEILVPITSGTRIAARVQAAVSSDVCYITMSLFSSTFTIDSFAATAFGVDTSNSSGSLVPDPGGTANTLGAYTEVSSSLPHDITHMLVSWGNNGNLVFGNDFMWMYQLSTGAASSEVVKQAGMQVVGSAAETLAPTFALVPFIASSGTRVAVRCQCSATNATDRLLDMSFIGLNSAATVPGGGGGGIAHIVGEGGIVG